MISLYVTENRMLDVLSVNPPMAITAVNSKLQVAAQGSKLVNVRG